MSRWLLLMLGVVFLPALAQAQCPGLTAPPIPFAKEVLTISNTAQALTESVYKPTGVTAILAIISLEGGETRYQVIGTPTAADGHPLPNNATITICGFDSIRAFRTIRVTTDVRATTTYYRPK